MSFTSCRIIVRKTFSVTDTFVSAFTISFAMTSSYGEGWWRLLLFSEKILWRKSSACNFRKVIAFLSWREKFKFVWFIWILSGSWGDLWHSAAFVRIGQQDLQRCKHSQFLRSLSGCVPFCLCLSPTFLFVCLFFCLPLCLSVSVKVRELKVSCSPLCVKFRCLSACERVNLRCHITWLCLPQMSVLLKEKELEVPCLPDSQLTSDRCLCLW